MSRSPAQRARAKYADYCRLAGKPLQITPGEQARLVRHLERLQGRGMSHRQIADASGINISDRSVTKIVSGTVGFSRRATYDALMRTRYVAPEGLRSGRRMSPVGVQRRLQGLVADGWGYTTLGPLLGVSLQAVNQLVKRETVVAGSTHVRIVALYDKLEHADPLDYGSTVIGVARAKGVARKFGWVPTDCWAPDTIDDPDALPEWTGRCGTVLGTRIHYREKIPMCDACSVYDFDPRLPGFLPAEFRALREKRGMSRRILAETVGMNESTVVFWEQGRSAPFREFRIDQALSVLDATFEDVYDMEDPGWEALKIKRKRRRR